MPTCDEPFDNEAFLCRSAQMRSRLSQITRKAPSTWQP